jgi:hypothetical protein
MFVYGTSWEVRSGFVKTTVVFSFANTRVYNTAPRGFCQYFAAVVTLCPWGGGPAVGMLA